MKQSFPKVLIISRGVWDDTKGTSSTLTNIFQDYDADKLAHIYMDTARPNTKCCKCFFQISEFSLVRKLYKWNTKIGFEIDTNSRNNDSVEESIAAREDETMKYVRSHRSVWFSFAREVLWRFNGWKSKELRQFIKNFNPDVVWMDGCPVPCVNRLYRYVLNIAKKPAVIFMQDDIYTYESCDPRLTSKFYKWLLRRQVRRVVEKCDDMFVASPKMKKEYDEIFGFDSTFIAKSAPLEIIPSTSTVKTHQPIRMVYMGQIIYGRIYTLVEIAQALKVINRHGIKIQLFIYTNNEIPDEMKDKLLVKDGVFLQQPVPYQEVSRVIAEHDVVLFVESFDPEYCKIARLSFSTKIFDYLTSAKCVFAVGPADSAPIEYFMEEDAAIVADSKEKISNKIKELENPKIVQQYANKALLCARKNHDRANMNSIIYGKIKQITKEL